MGNLLDEMIDSNITNELNRDLQVDPNESDDILYYVM